MTDRFKASIRVRWADLAFNGHMRNTAFLDASADTPMLFFDRTASRCTSSSGSASAR